MIKELVLAAQLIIVPVAPKPQCVTLPVEVDVVCEIMYTGVAKTTESLKCIDKDGEIFYLTRVRQPRSGV